MDRCPTCQREFKKLEDYPLAYIIGFERKPLEEVILDDYTQNYLEEPDAKDRYFRPLPKEVLKILKGDGVDMVKYEGRIFRKTGMFYGVQSYESNTDLKPKLVECLSRAKDLEDYLVFLENSVGKEVETKKLFPEWPKDQYFKILMVPSTLQDLQETRLIFYISFNEKKGGKEGCCEINLLRPGASMGAMGGPQLSPISCLAEIKYEGRLKKEEVDE